MVHLAGSVFGGRTKDGGGMNGGNDGRSEGRGDRFAAVLGDPEAVASRYWVLRYVQRLCRAAGVPTVPAHGLRGTQATLAVDAGSTSHLVVAALGHESFTTTARHYAKGRSH